MISPDWYNLPVKTASARIAILLDETWFGASDLVDNTEIVIGHFTSNAMGSPPNSSFAGGFFIDADGVSIADDEATDIVDELHMHIGWLSAILDTLDGRRKSQIWAWEESNMTVHRLDDDTVVVSDVHHSGHVVCSPVRFCAVQLASALLAAVRPLVRVIEQIHARLTGLDPDLDHPVDEPLRSQIISLRNAFSLEWKAKQKALETLLESPFNLPAPREPPLAPPAAFALIQARSPAGFVAHLEAHPEDLSLVYRGDTLLHQAAAFGDIEGVQLLLARGAEPRIKNTHGRTSLHQACAYSGAKPAIVRLLIAHGADIDELDEEGNTALDRAASVSSNHEVVALLLSLGAKVGYTAAVRLRHWSALETLLLTGVPVRAKGLLLCIFQAIMTDSGSQTHVLLDKAAEPWGRLIPRLAALGLPFEREGAELLTWAFEVGNSWTAGWLIGLGARPAAPKGDRSVLDLARQTRNPELMTLANRCLG